MKESNRMKNSIVEKEFIHNGLECLIRLTSMGHRCGYVKVPEDSKLAERVLESLPVHGGVTCIEHHHPETWETTKGLWVGFDCGHCFDKPDRVAVEAAGMDFNGFDREVCFSGGDCFPFTLRLWTLPMVEAEVKAMADQIAGLMAGKKKTNGKETSIYA